MAHNKSRPLTLILPHVEALARTANAQHIVVERGSFRHHVHSSSMPQTITRKKIYPRALT